MSGNGLLRGVDRAAFAVAFVDRLRHAGVPVGFTGITDLVRALDAGLPDSPAGLYWTARISLVRRHSEIAAFDAVFAALFGDAPPLVTPGRVGTPRRAGDAYAAVAGADGGPADGGGLPWLTLPPVVAAAEEAAHHLAVPDRLPSRLAALADTPFADLAADDVAVLGAWLERALRTWPTRRGRRLKPDRSGHRIALRPTVVRARRTGWETIDLVRVRAVRRPRRVVLLCDVSRSMQAQATAYLHLMRAFALVADAEVFAFATTLTRLTAVLAHRSATVAIDQASATVTDRFGGTRIASNVRALLSSHHGNAVRGAIVIIGSDGWDSDPPAEVAAAMARLRRRAYRVIWMNPRAAAPGFQPRVATMAAALPYCDALLPAHTFQALADVVAAVSSTASRGSTAGNARR